MEGPTEEMERVKQGRMYRWTADADRREVEEELRREDNRQRRERRTRAKKRVQRNKEGGGRRDGGIGRGMEDWRRRRRRKWKEGKVQ